jgi:hypothetical protein
MLLMLIRQNVDPKLRVQLDAFLMDLKPIFKNYLAMLHGINFLQSLVQGLG